MEKTFIVYFAWKLFQDGQSSLGLEIDGLIVSERTIIRVHNHLLRPLGHRGLSQRIVSYALMSTRITACIVVRLTVPKTLHVY
jgi:hypothetical protein